MTLPAKANPVLAMPMFDPGQGRINITLPAGLTVAEIVKATMRDRPVRPERCRVSLVTSSGSAVIPPDRWHRVKPRPGVQIVIRVLPGKGALKSILSIVISIAAVALGQFWAPGLAGTWGITEAGWQGIIALGASMLGNLLLNALIPPPKPDDKTKNSYSISGWKNRLEPDGAIPLPLGEIRYAPPFACLPHTEIVGDDQYIRAVFCFGYGRLPTDDYRLGDTSLAEYHNVDIEPREGVAGDLPLSLMPYQIAEEAVGADLTRPYPRDELGEIIPHSEAIETPVSRSTGADASGASVIVGFTAGLFAVNDEGKLRKATVRIKIQQRQVQADEWQDVETLEISARKREGFYRQHTWDFPTRGRWQVRLIMLTPEILSTQVSARAAWVAIQTIRPEYPIAIKKPMALVAVRIKATHQLNGQLDNFNARVRRVCVDYDHTTGTWIERPTRNPASLFRFVLQSNATARPAADAGIDLAMLQDWHDFCRIKGLKYDRVIDDTSLSMRDLLTEIAAAGRASPRHDGRQWGVVIDRPQTMVIDHFSPRNSYGFKTFRRYMRPPHGVIVSFLDETNDNKPSQRIIPWPGHDGEMTELERLEMPGKTDPVEVFREARRRQYETIYRPDSWRFSVDLPVTSATRGDLVMLSQDVIDRTQLAARVNAVEGKLIEIDEPVTMQAGKIYAVRFRVYEVRPSHLPPDTIGMSVVRTVVTVPGETVLLTVTGDGDMPVAGCLLHFGIAGQESVALIALEVEAGDGASSHFRLVDAAPIIDELTDALVIPAWSGRVGAEIDQNLLAPPVPRFTSISTGFSGADATGKVSYLIAPGTGPVPSARFEIDHRLVGAPNWTPVTIPAANGGGELQYANGDQIQIRGRAKSAAGTPSAYTTVITLTVGAGDAAIPAALDGGTVSLEALLGGATVMFATGDDIATTRVQLYRSTSAVLNRATDAVGNPIAVEPGRGYSVPIGDATRQNLVLNGGFDNASIWTPGTGWTISAGKASKVTSPGGSPISQPIAFASGKYYRVSFELSGVTAGTIVPWLYGGTTRAGVTRNANGTYVDRIQAVTGNNLIYFLANNAFVGSLDNVVVYQETATCLSQGTHYIFLEPQNSDGVPGPVAGPFSVTIR